MLSLPQPLSLLALHERSTRIDSSAAHVVLVDAELASTDLTTATTLSRKSKVAYLWDTLVLVGYY